MNNRTWNERREDYSRMVKEKKKNNLKVRPEFRINSRKP
jgi:hypothetical protein